ncbi:hypothetical protein K2173_027360 [Erythroxylum novogranatense]|uniref:Transmembrane protein n=1 Tax=Erythroxylum novogranatense TaxID=1862640 RepID=A0AAV8TZ50_9ROSI|nr:hypothetical protein K2173_027360 [Erythroxylum novogranatense]
MESTISSLPGQQQPLGEIEQPNQQGLLSSTNNTNNNNAWSSSGSIGPFFAVISVLAVLAILSCVLGRIYSRRQSSPFNNIKQGGCLEWVKRKCRRCIAGDIEAVGANKVMAFGGVQQKDGIGDDPPHA